MVARFAAGSLGLLAFFVSMVAGLCVQNPVTVTLSRSILALFVFCIIGFILGGAAQLVVAEYQRTQESAIRKEYEEHSPAEAGSDQRNAAGGGQ